jgi:hypothetical protein
MVNDAHLIRRGSTLWVVVDAALVALKVIGYVKSYSYRAYCCYCLL